MSKIKVTIPNSLTILRGILTLVIIVLFFTDMPQRFVWIYALFLAASISDYLDGYLARKWKAVSRFGKMFDPLFDKILTLSLFMLLLPYPGMPSLIFVLLFLRELIVDGLKNYLLSYGIATPAIWSAKLKMVFQVLLLNFALLTLIFSNVQWLFTATYICAIGALLFAFWSAGSYVKKFWKFYSKNITTK